jgi:hypothetical protein
MTPWLEVGLGLGLEIELGLASKKEAKDAQPWKKPPG